MNKIYLSFFTLILIIFSFSNTSLAQTFESEISDTRTEKMKLLILPAREDTLKEYSIEKIIGCAILGWRINFCEISGVSE